MILPLAVVVGLCQLLLPADLIPSNPVAAHLIPAHRDRVAENERRSAQAAAAAPSDLNGAEIAGIGANGKASPGAPVRVMIRHAAGPRNALPAMQLAAHLQMQGFVVDEIRPVESEVERPSVRYFFASDQPDSHRLGEAVRAFLTQAPARAPAEVEDFSDASPKPQRGRMEVWLPPLPGAGGSHSS